MEVCPSCNKNLTIPSTYSGRVRCPTCSQEFRIEALIQGGSGEDGEDYSKIKIYKDQRFWIGLVVPTMAPIIALILLSTGIHQPTSPDIMGLFYFMCSLCLWPVIGFGLAFSSGTFVRSLREGARVSAIIAVIIVFLAGIWLINLLSGGITN